MKTSKPFWYFLLSLLVFGIVTFWILFPFVNEKIIVITQWKFIIIFFLGIISSLLFGILMKHDSTGNPIEEISVLQEGIFFEIVTHKILYVGKQQEIVHLVHIECDDDENYDTVKYISLKIENSDLENPALFTKVENWKKVPFTYLNGKICRPIL